MVRYEFSLCIGQANTDSGITVKCHDDGISFLIKLMVCRQVSKWRTKEETFAIPEGSKVILKISKPDNTKCLISGTVKAEGVLFKSRPEAFAVAGISEAEVSVYGPDGRRATTATFNIDVPEECVCNCDVESEPYIDIIGEQIKAAKEAEAGAKQAAKAATQAQVNGPKIGDNGNWFVWHFEKGEYVDTGFSSVGNPPSDEQVEDAVQTYMDENPVDSKVDEAVSDYLDRNADRHAEYFTITDDGIISLKPEYRGACPNDALRKDFTYAISDNGYGVDGSKNAELPKYLVIPEVVDTTAVVSLAPGMFIYNSAVETIVLPSTVTAIPDRFCDVTKEVRNLYNTEGITSIGLSAFQYCGVEKAKFPNLTNMGSHAFCGCGNLKYVDIGKVKDIPSFGFAFCMNLSRIKGGADVASVGVRSLENNYRLNNVEFLPNLTSIGNGAFVCTRLNFDWNSLTGCSFGSMATAKQLNPTDIWSACTVTPTENPVPTLLSQLDARWSDREIGSSGITYFDGCVLFSIIHAYCALHNKTLSTVYEFEDIANGISPDILNNFTKSYSCIEPICQALGLKLDHPGVYTQTRLQAVYDALAAGKYVLLPMSPAWGATAGHMTLAYGVKENKELLVADSSFSPSVLWGGSDKGLKYSMLYQNMIKSGSHVYIVSLE